MLIRIKRNTDPSGAEITPKSLFDRRDILMAAAAFGGLAALGPKSGQAATVRNDPIPNLVKSRYQVEDALTDYKSVTTYNNFYELGTDKSDPVDNAKYLKPRPWTVTVDGACAKPGQIGIEDLLKAHAVEERVYRLRCVEAWSMVIPWAGIPLKDLLARFEPASAAKFVKFETLVDVKQMPGQRSRLLDWPYVEGLRIDEAMHPLTLMAVGLYGEILPAQNGAPLRLVVPWKYGFKSIKSIVRISFVETPPRTTWMIQAPREYGFYANVNPQVDHPRWSQAKERRIGELRKRDTLPFNGYAEDVAALYSGMDLKQYY